MRVKNALENVEAVSVVGVDDVGVDDLFALAVCEVADGPAVSEREGALGSLADVFLHFGFVVAVAWANGAAGKHFFRRICEVRCDLCGAAV